MFPYIAGAKRGIAKAKLRNGNVEREWTVQRLKIATALIQTWNGPSVITRSPR
jgi:hypothetical protein